MQTSNFKSNFWDKIDMEVTKVTGEQYSVKKLKGKFFCMRMKHRNFSDLTGTIGVTWDTSFNNVHAIEDIWHQFYAVYLNYFFNILVFYFIIYMFYILVQLSYALFNLIF